MDLAVLGRGGAGRTPQFGLGIWQACSVVAKYLKLGLETQTACLWSNGISGNLVETCQEVDGLWTHMAPFDVSTEHRHVGFKAEKTENTA